MPETNVPPTPENNPMNAQYIEAQLAEIRREIEKIKQFLAPMIEDAGTVGPKPDIEV